MSKTLGRLSAALALLVGLSILLPSAVAQAELNCVYYNLVSAIRPCSQPNRIQAVFHTDDGSKQGTTGAVFVNTTLGGKWGIGAGAAIHNNGGARYSVTTDVFTSGLVTQKPFTLPNRPLIIQWMVGTLGHAVAGNNYGAGTIALQPPECNGTPSATRVVIMTSVLTGTEKGSNYVVALKAAGGKAPYHWQPLQALPKGLTLVRTGPTAGTIEGSPRVSGSFTVAVRVTDARGHSTTKTWLLQIDEPPTACKPSTTTTIPLLP